ncbi:MAG: NAD-dependent epimerase/dehydratase family protein [Deltaproteobacteria bacterium]|nr:NAD-dependent epimerase/dehydratase family protein [Deltaproteobacteria bacterium]
MSGLAGRRIVVTGASGFLGRALVARLAREGAQVTGIARRSMRLEGVDWVDADLAVPAHGARLTAALQGCRAIVHLAARIPYFEPNVGGALGLLRVLPGGVGRMVLASTVDVYGRLRSLAVDEAHPTEPGTAYGASKLAGEVLARGYCRGRALRLITLRFAQIYGPGAPTTKAIPIFLDRARRGEPLPLYGDGSELRQPLYLDDAVEAIVAALETSAEGIFNIAGPEVASIRAIAGLIRQLAGRPLGLSTQPGRPDRMSLTFDCDRAKQALGFTPRVSLEQGLRACLDAGQDPVGVEATDRAGGRNGHGHPMQAPRTALAVGGAGPAAGSALPELARLDAVAGWYDPKQDFDGVLVPYAVERVARWRAGSHALELGCATGAMTALLARHFPALDVVEGSARYLDAARTALAGTPARMSFHEGLVEAFRPRRRYSDIILAHLLEHVADPVALLRRCREWLEPGGRLHVLVPNAWSVHRLIGAALGIIPDVHGLGERDHQVGHRRVYDPESLQADLRAGGLALHHLEGILLKPLPNQQMAYLGEEVLQLLHRAGDALPLHCAELYAACGPDKESR